MKKTALLLILSVVFASLFLGKASALQDEKAVDVTSQILTGSDRSDYYVGDHFWYNISLRNSGTTSINSTFKVEIRNSTGAVLEATKQYPIFLERNETTFLYPNYTRLGKEEVNVYFFQATGTYSIVLSSSIPLKFYTYLDNGRYSFTTSESTYPFDVMPSYERVQNDLWNQFLNKNENYMNQVQQYIQQSEIQSQKTTNLTYFTIIIAVFSIFIAIGGIFVSWWQLGKEKKKQNQLVFRTFLIFCVVFLMLLFVEFWIIAS